MKSKRVIGLVGTFAFAGAVSTAAFAGERTETNASCVLRNHHVNAVQPYKVQQRVGRVEYSHLGGATAHVAAEPGLTAQWLRVDLGREARACGQDTKDVRLLVEPASTGFNVRFIPRSPGDAKDVLRDVRETAYER